MKTILSTFVLLALSVCALCPRASAQCEDVPAGQTLRVRLLQPISSYSTKVGATVRGILIESPRCDDEPLLPEGSVVQGSVKSVHKVGLGFRYEVATLEMEFDRILPRDGPPIHMRARVQRVDDARERVIAGVIHGIRVTNTPQDHLTSRVEYFTMWSPSTFWILPAYRMAVPFLPEPEIYFPAGTDLVLELASSVAATPSDASVAAPSEFVPSQEAILDSRAADVPDRTYTPNGRDADGVNLVFLGSEEQVKDAFQSAGWMGSDPMSGRTALREIGAFLLMRNNPRGPMSRQVLGGATQAISLQKGLDTLAIRDHMRIWRTSQDWFGRPVWFAASTQDVTATLSLRRMKFIHHVDGNIDLEREKIVRDLSLAGCVRAEYNASRPAMPRFFENATGDRIHTDGDVSIVELKQCDARSTEKDEMVEERVASRPASFFSRYVRTQILSFRDVWRENAFYGAFDTGRDALHAIQRDHARRVTRSYILNAQQPIAPPLSANP